VEKNGSKWCKVGEFVIFLRRFEAIGMITFIGDYSVRLDSKGRISLPSAFKRQMLERFAEGFVLKRDVFDKCLILYPMQEWERQNQIIRSKTNPYNREHNQFLRMFYSGTAEVVPDSNNRILLPRRLMDFAEIADEAIMAGQYGKIEIWSATNYATISKADDEFARMAEKILGNSIEQTNEG
jgi:MraZ protein